MLWGSRAPSLAPHAVDYLEGVYPIFHPAVLFLFIPIDL